VVADGRPDDRHIDSGWHGTGCRGVDAGQGRPGPHQNRGEAGCRRGGVLCLVAGDQGSRVGFAPDGHVLADQPDRGRSAGLVALVGLGSAGHHCRSARGGAHRVATGQPEVVRCVGGPASAGLVAALDGVLSQASRLAACLRLRHEARPGAGHGDADSLEPGFRPSPTPRANTAPKGGRGALRCVLGSGSGSASTRAETGRLRSGRAGTGFGSWGGALPGARTVPQRGVDRFSAPQFARRPGDLPGSRRADRDPG
jgi:hypothetical protein